MKEPYLTIITYLQVIGRPSCGQEAIAMARLHNDENTGFKELVIAVDVMQQ